MTTQELCTATGYSAPALVDLEKSGVIAREARDKWPFETVRKIISHLRERKPQLSDEQRAYHAARADREKLKYAAELKKIGSVEEMTGALDAMVGWYISALETLPSAIRQARSDRGLRAALVEWVTNTRNALAEKAEATAKALPEGATVKIWL
jgi:hypothetical protein